LCEDFVTEKFFNTDGRALMRTFYPYICNIRKEWNNAEQYVQVVTYYLGENVDICNE